ncbi:MAG TPA: CHAP domain-containing protein [Ktedonobacteraceae bacterium]|nr:CHAP domain-containing protein [Ktedonobacteraceae bacterium]
MSKQSFDDRPPGTHSVKPGQFMPPVLSTSARDNAGQQPASPALLPPTITPHTAALPKTTRQLTAILPIVSTPDTQRTPLVIKGEMKKVALVPPPAIHHKRRSVVNLSVMALLALIIILTFLTVTPLGRDMGLNFNSLQIGGSLFSSHNNSPDDLVVQATATAIYHQQNDGYDPSSNKGQQLTEGNVSLNWPVGQCTYWANLRYHTLTGHWIPWNGNASQWVAGARSAGWTVSTTPHVPSIMVLMPGVQGAGGYGHVAIVESVSGNTVHVSNMNWYSNGGGFNITSNADFTTGSGTYFVWHP